MQQAPRRSLVAVGLALSVALSACASGTSDAGSSSPTPSTSITLASQSERTCATAGASAPGGCWREVRPLGSGGFPPSPGSQDRPVWKPGEFPVTLPPRLAFDNKLWMTAQTVAYSSVDGLEWIQHSKTNWGGRIYNSIVYFKGKLWMFGGLDYEARTFFNDIWSSSDGTAWKKVGTAAWRPRGSATFVVYRGRLWMFGGANHIAADRSTDGFVNDVWVSDDGVAWARVTGAAAWSPRDNPGVVVFNDKLYLIGGHGRADVWRSSNGKAWTRLARAAPWGHRHFPASLVFGGKLWVFGGYIGASTNAMNDVWFSSDGANWKRQAEHAPWGPRVPLTIVYRNKIWIYSGKHTGADDNWGGDLWQMTASTTAR